MVYLIAQQGCHVQSTSSYFAISSYRAGGRYEHISVGCVRLCFFNGFYADITNKHQQKAAHEGKKAENLLNNNKDNLVPDEALQTKFLYWVIDWVIVGWQCYQISWQLQSSHTDNQLTPNIRFLSVPLLELVFGI